MAKGFNGLQRCVWFQVVKIERVYRSCDIHFEISYLQSLSSDFPAFDEFLSAVEKGKAQSLADHHHYCTREMVAGTEAILDNPFALKVQPYILATKVREILIGALEKVAGDMQKKLPAINKQQQEALLHVKSLIDKGADTAISLPDLVRASGMNECTLKRGFRLLFDASPYQYHVQQKMKRAQLLLIETGESIAMISYELGYSQPSSFGNEFRKATGLTPAQFRKAAHK